MKSPTLKGRAFLFLGANAGVQLFLFLPTCVRQLSLLHCGIGLEKVKTLLSVRCLFVFTQRLLAIASFMRHNGANEASL
jgi:hypothetical protein